jgi:hypothetical protein
MIGPNKLRQDVSVKRITLGLAHAKPIPDPIQRLGIDRINHHPVIQKKLDNPPVRLLDGRPKFYLFRLTLVEPAAKLAHPFWTLDHLHLDYLLALWITDPHLIKLRPNPLPNSIASLSLPPSLCVSNPKGCERNVRLISVLQQGTTFY